MVLIAPLFAVFMIDESCLRLYLSFAPDLRSLMEACDCHGKPAFNRSVQEWGIHHQGAAAYRNGFCGRRLIAEFGYGDCEAQLHWHLIMMCNCSLVDDSAHLYVRGVITTLTAIGLISY